MTTNQTFSETLSNSQLTSKRIINNIDNLIIQLFKILLVEYQITSEAAKEMTRNMLQDRLNEIMTDDDKEAVERLTAALNTKIKNRSINDVETQANNVLKIMRLK